MNKLTKYALAAGVPVAILAGFAQSASATSITTTPPAGPTATNPAVWQTLVDDTGLLSVSVPAEWTDIDTVPGVNDDGTSRPFIEAAPSLEDYHNSFSYPGVTYVAIPATTDLDAALAAFDVGDCADETTQPYNDNVFVGTMIHQTGCSAGGAEFVKVAANSTLNPAVTIVIEIGITTPAEEPIAQSILQSFGFAGAAPVTPTTPTVTTVPGVVPTVPAVVPTVPPVSVPATVPAVTVPGPTVAPVTVPAVTVPPATVPGATVPGASVPGTFTVAADAVPVNDDTMHIGISLPADWTDIVTAPQTINGATQPTIIASTDLSVFLPDGPDTFGAPGVIYTAYPYTADPTTVLSDMSGSCVVDGAPEQYFDGVFTGLLQRYSSCGGTATRIVTVAASPADGSFTAHLLIQLTDADDTDLNTLLASFGYDPAAFGTTPGVGPATTTIPGA